MWLSWCCYGPWSGQDGISWSCFGLEKAECFLPRCFSQRLCRVFSMLGGHPVKRTRKTEPARTFTRAGKLCCDFSKSFLGVAGLQKCDKRTQIRLCPNFTSQPWRQSWVSLTFLVQTWAFGSLDADWTSYNFDRTVHSSESLFCSISRSLFTYFQNILAAVTLWVHLWWGLMSASEIMLLSPRNSIRHCRWSLRTLPEYHSLILLIHSSLCRGDGLLLCHQLDAKCAHWGNVGESGKALFVPIGYCLISKHILITSLPIRLDDPVTKRFFCVLEGSLDPKRGRHNVSLFEQELGRSISMRNFIVCFWVF